MEKTIDITSRYYLVFKSLGVIAVLCVMIGARLSAGSPLDTYNARFSDLSPSFSTNFAAFRDSVEQDDSMVDSPIIYPGRPLIMSLVVPGLGQVYNRDSWLKVGAFAGIEMTGLFAYFDFLKKANQIQSDYETFADNNWSLDKWVWDSIQLQSITNEYHDVIIDGTHSFFIHLTGALADEYGEYVGSDFLATYPYWVDDDGVMVIRDRNFYENIGKYDQFVAGWSDFDPNNVITVNKDVGDSTEILITTPKKNKYLDMRFDSNNYLKMANYALTAVLFNHVWSAIDAVYIANRKRHEKSRQIKTDVGLLYDHRTKYGIGGISFSVQF